MTDYDYLPATVRAVHPWGAPLTQDGEDMLSATVRVPAIDADATYQHYLATGSVPLPASETRWPTMGELCGMAAFGLLCGLLASI